MVGMSNRITKHARGVSVRGIFYDVNEAAQILGVQPRTINTLVHRGQLSCVKYGNLTFYLHDELAHFLDQKRANRSPRRPIVCQ